MIRWQQEPLKSIVAHTTYVKYYRKSRSKKKMHGILKQQLQKVAAGEAGKYI